MKKKIRVKKVTVTYDLDHVLEYHYTTINGVLDKAGNHLKNEKPVRDWYVENYPKDNLIGSEIKPDLKWDELFERMRCGECIYDITNVLDTVVRERIEGHLCLMLSIPHRVLNEL
jgi:hypothetical protein